MIHPNSLANLHPAKPGEVRNPTGRNQFSYRRDFELAIQRLAEGKYSGRVEDCEDAESRCWLCDIRECEHYATGIGPVHSKCLEQVREMTQGEVRQPAADRGHSGGS